jgi:hypothetical protein
MFRFVVLFSRIERYSGVEFPTNHHDAVLCLLHRRPQGRKVIGGINNDRNLICALGTPTRLAATKNVM